MDFLKLLKSFEEFVYEALLWLILVPKTLGRILLRPRTMTTYASAQLATPDDRRFNEAISPPLLLILCVLIAQFIDLGVRAQVPASEGSMASVLLASEQNLLLYRTVAFGIWALAGAVYFLVRSRVPINRESLRAPFYEQCYLVCPFALLLSISLSMALIGEQGALLGAVLAIVGALWFWLVQAYWMRHKAGMSPWRSLVAGMIILLIGSLSNALLGQVLSRSHALPPSKPVAQVAGSVEGDRGR
ncbi:MAG: hypothetical protein ABIS07_16690 [Dokdonella sp.]